MGPDIVGAAQAETCRIIVVSESWLLAVLGSFSLPATDTGFVINPAVGTVTEMVTVAFWPFAIAPSAQLTEPGVIEQLPCDGVAVSAGTPEGSESATVTPVALPGPPL